MGRKKLPETDRKKHESIRMYKETKEYLEALSTSGASKQEGFDMLIETAKNTFPVLVNKTCACCEKKHLSVPKTAKYKDTGDRLDGYYWECSCGSTLFLPKHKRSK